jgi:hypothetical protein
VAPAGAAVAGGLGGSILPLGALEAVEEAYGAYAKVLDEPEAGFDLTLQIETAKIPTDDGELGERPASFEHCQPVGKCCFLGPCKDCVFRWARIWFVASPSMFVQRKQR